MGRTQVTDETVVTQAVKHAKLVEQSRKLARIVKHVDPDAKTKRKRTMLEKSLTKWMKFHGAEAFDRPFCADHEKAISKIETAINGGGMFALAMPRGSGKTTILKYAILYCLLTGRRRYVVVVAATGEMAQALIEFTRQQIQESETLHEHYPHVTTYARATDGKAIKAKYQLRADGKTSGIQWSKNALVLPDSISDKKKPYPSNGAILEGHGLTGAIRGKWRDTKSGKVLRPDFVLLDDPQTRESAESESQCNMRERIITGDVLGLAGPRKRITAVMPCTVVRKGDLAARFLDHEVHPEWQGETCKLVPQWPETQDTLWKEYAIIYKDDGLKKATAFYKRNQKAMDSGAVVSWSHRVRDGEVSALQTAQNLLIETGEQFWAEYQNEPREVGVTLYTLTPKIVADRIDKCRAPGDVPDWVREVVATTDVNPSYALTSVVVGFGADQRCAVLWYGLHKLDIPDTATDAQKKGYIMAQLEIHGKKLAALPCRPARWMIDGGGSPQDTVVTFCANSVRTVGIEAITAFGRAWRQYRSRQADRRYEQCLIRSESRLRRWCLWNADYWREAAQRGWIGAVGAPGTVDLPTGNHREFAEQVCREQLGGKAETGGTWVYVWHTLPGAHDYGDCMAMAYACAALVGIGTGGNVGSVKKVKRKQQKRRARHVSI